MMRRWPLLFVLALAACGGASDEPDAPSDDSSTSAAATEPATSDCVTNLAVTNKATGTVTTMTNGGAVSLAGGSAYTLYAADFPIDTSTASLAFEPEGPPDGHFVMVAATVLNATGPTEPITAGTSVAAGVTPGELVLVTRYDAGPEALNNNIGASGQITFDEVGESVCATVDYSDDEKQMTGTIGSAVAAVS